LLFFFQAEDGIRDLYVTGVQTCALPISDERHDPGPSVVGWLGALSTAETLVLLVGLVVLGVLAIEGWALIQLLGQNGRLLARLRSEERRVGREGRSWMAAAR